MAGAAEQIVLELEQINMEYETLLHQEVQRRRKDVGSVRPLNHLRQREGELWKYKFTLQTANGHCSPHR